MNKRFSGYKCELCDKKILLKEPFVLFKSFDDDYYFETVVCSKCGTNEKQVQVLLDKKEKDIISINLK